MPFLTQDDLYAIEKQIQNLILSNDNLEKTVQAMMAEMEQMGECIETLKARKTTRKSVVKTQTVQTENELLPLTEDE
jgi:peptidoglycan hydrolase CwlO-like protein